MITARGKIWLVSLFRVRNEKRAKLERDNPIHPLEIQNELVIKVWWIMEPLGMTEDDFSSENAVVIPHLSSHGFLEEISPRATTGCIADVKFTSYGLEVARKLSE